MEKNIGEEPCLAQAFISSLKDFMRIDQKKTLALISSIRNPDYTQIVAELSGYPTIQMKIIEDVISQ